MVEKIVDFLKPFFSWEGLIGILIIALFIWAVVRLGDWVEKKS